MSITILVTDIVLDDGRNVESKIEMYEGPSRGAKGTMRSTFIGLQPGDVLTLRRESFARRIVDPAIDEPFRMTWPGVHAYLDETVGRSTKAEGGAASTRAKRGHIKAVIERLRQFTSEVHHAIQDLVAAEGEDTPSIAHDPLFSRLPQRHAGLDDMGDLGVQIQMQLREETSAPAIELISAGIPPKMAVRWARAYGRWASWLVTRIPWRALRVIDGFGPATLDDVLANLNPTDYVGRMSGRVLGLLEQYAGQGSTVLPFVDAMSRLADVSLAIDEHAKAASDEPLTPRTAVRNLPPSLSAADADRPVTMLEAGLLRVLYDYKYLVTPWDDAIVASNHAGIQLDWLAEVEKAVAEAVNRKLSAKPAPISLPSDTEMQRVAAENSMEWLPQHVQLFNDLRTQAITVLTGGPGTGKTSTMRLLVQACQRGAVPYVLLAPTNRAAARLREVTGGDVQTIFAFLQGSPLTAAKTLVIADEASMLSADMAAKLLGRQITMPMTRVLLVGDPNQLLSIDPGAVMRDLLASGHVPSVRLTRVFRTGEQSRIPDIADLVLEGRMPVVNDPSELTGYIKLKKADDPVGTVLECVRQMQQRGIAKDDIQILTPGHNGPLGTKNLNAAVLKQQGRYGVTFAPGDRVIFKTNMRLASRVIAANGDIGQIAEIKNGVIYVKNGDVVVDVLYRTASTQLEHAYASTVHSAQGNEFEGVIVCASDNHRPLLDRRILYTAITRARRSLWLVMSQHLMELVLEDDFGTARLTTLSQRVTAPVPQTPDQSVL